MKILVAYSSKYGATQEIAEKIGQILKQAGSQVEVLQVKEAKDIKHYDAFVLGTAAYMFQWRWDFTSFLKKNQDILSQKPSWIFYSGPLGKGDALQLVKGQRNPKSLQTVIDHIKPKDITVFHGLVNMDKLNFFEKFAFKKTPEMVGDFRDWDAIGAWAKGISAGLKKAQK
jgi:menaquinone-dependent protoporphyrinogen oxidase